MEVSGQVHAPVALPHWTGGWVGPSAGLDAVERRKILRRKSNPGRPARTVVTVVR
jgi:hypothetical protein